CRFPLGAQRSANYARCHRSTDGSLADTAASSFALSGPDRPGWRCQSAATGSVLWAHLEAQHPLAEPASAHGTDDHSHDHPACADELRGVTQVDPQQQTGDEPRGGWPEVT